MNQLFTSILILFVALCSDAEGFFDQQQNLKTVSRVQRLEPVKETSSQGKSYVNILAAEKIALANHRAVTQSFSNNLAQNVEAKATSEHLSKAYDGERVLDANGNLKSTSFTPSSSGSEFSARIAQEVASKNLQITSDDLITAANKRLAAAEDDKEKRAKAIASRQVISDHHKRAERKISQLQAAIKGGDEETKQLANEKLESFLSSKYDKPPKLEKALSEIEQLAEADQINKKVFQIDTIRDLKEKGPSLQKELDKFANRRKNKALVKQAQGKDALDQAGKALDNAIKAASAANNLSSQGSSESSSGDAESLVGSPEDAFSLSNLQQQRSAIDEAKAEADRLFEELGGEEALKEALVRNPELLAQINDEFNQGGVDLEQTNSLKNRLAEIRKAKDQGGAESAPSQSAASSSFGGGSNEDSESDSSEADGDSSGSSTLAANSGFGGGSGLNSGGDSEADYSMPDLKLPDFGNLGKEAKKEEQQQAGTQSLGLDRDKVNTKDFIERVSDPNTLKMIRDRRLASEQNTPLWTRIRRFYHLVQGKGTFERPRTN